MKITIESTGAIVHANGLPTRLWEGKTERGTPVIALITRLGVPEGTDARELERDLGPEQPTRLVVEGQEPVITGRSCTVCLARNKRRDATHVARDAGGLEWFECGQHDPTDNVAETIRVVLEPIAAWFDRHDLPLPDLPLPGAAAAAAPPNREPSWLVKDFWVLYSAARQLNETLIAALDDAHAEADGETHAGALLRGELVARTHQGLARQLDRLAPAFDFCEAERRGEPAPDAAVPNADELVARARGRVMRADVFALRSIVGGWREHDEVTLTGPALLASGLLTALDALAIVHGPEAEAEAAELDKFMAQTAGQHARPAPRAVTDAERAALTALHRWLHSGRGDCELIEAAQEFHDQVESESPAECQRLEAEEQAEREADAAARAAADRANESARSLFDRVGAALGIGMPEPPAEHEGCSPDAAPPSPLAGKIIRAIVLDERAVDAATDEPSKLFMAHALRGAQMGWHARLKHPGEVDRVAELAAPKDEPTRSAWLFGFGVAVRTADPATAPTPAAPSVVIGGVCRACGCTNDDCSQCVAKTGVPCHWVEPDLCSACAPETRDVVLIDPKAPVPLWVQAERPAQRVPVSEIPASVLERLDAPVVVTTAMREYYRDELCYRAPETLNDNERRIIAAIEAEEKARAEQPDTWVGGQS